MFDKNPVFEMSCNVRPIKAFSPGALLEADTDSFRLYLTSDAKLMWFHQFCAEQGITGVVNTQFLKSEELKDVADENFVGGIVSPMKEYWEATVIMNGAEVSKATSSGTFLVNDRKERDLASRQLRKQAIGAALSQAGFGIIDGFDMSADDIQRITVSAQAAAASGQSGAAQPSPSPVPAPSAPASGTVMQDSFFGAPAYAQQGYENPAEAQRIYSASANNQQFASAPITPHAPPAQPAPVQKVDPLTAAKQVLWPMNGPMKGVPLVEVGVGKLRWAAGDGFNPTTEEGHRVKEAAKLILASLPDGK